MVACRTPLTVTWPAARVLPLTLRMATWVDGRRFVPEMVRLPLPRVNSVVGLPAVDPGAEPGDRGRKGGSRDAAAAGGGDGHRVCRAGRQGTESGVLDHDARGQAGIGIVEGQRSGQAGLVQFARRHRNSRRPRPSSLPFRWDCCRNSSRQDPVAQAGGPAAGPGDDRGEVGMPPPPTGLA